MKNAMKLYNLGQALMVLGSALYLVEIFTLERKWLTAAITVIYIVSLILLAIGWLGTRDERRAERERERQEEAARKAAKKAARDAA